MIRAAIFDLDGTLVDSNDLHAGAWQEAFRHFGKEIAYRDLRQQIGKGGDQYLPVYASGLTSSVLHAEICFSARWSCNNSEKS